MSSRYWTVHGCVTLLVWLLLLAGGCYWAWTVYR